MKTLSGNKRISPYTSTKQAGLNMCLGHLLGLGMRRDLFGRVQYSWHTLNHAFPLKCLRHAIRCYILIVSKDVARMLALLINIFTCVLRQPTVLHRNARSQGSVDILFRVNYERVVPRVTRKIKLSNNTFPQMMRNCGLLHETNVAGFS
jgi:hypothetical protein